jgi:molybdopterin molybdotransferase
MEIEIQLSVEPIAEKISSPLPSGSFGAWVEFRGVVRGAENDRPIGALEYEAYPEMAAREMQRILEVLAAKHPCLAAKVIHRTGIIPVGDTAIYVGVAARHRAEAIALLAEFMNRLKQDVPIWKRRSLPFDFASDDMRSRASSPKQSATAHVVSHDQKNCSLDEAMSKVRARCHPLPGERVTLADAFGRILRELVSAPQDQPLSDRSLRDGYAILANDPAEIFLIVDTLHAADWKPRQLKPGETVRVATGASLPCDGLRVVMQENVERNADQIHVLRRELARHVRLRGEDVREGQTLLTAGIRLDAGKLALLASVGCVEPSVNPKLHVCHFTTGDEIVPPDQTPKLGQIRDSNSILIRSLLQNFPCDLAQVHLPENFEQAKLQIANRKPQIENADVLLVSGGASVGEKDFTRPLLEWLGYEIIFSQINLRPGRPLIFGVNGARVAFGLPGNPLSHFVCFHFAVATALARLAGGDSPSFRRGRLATKLADEPCPRETLWPARLEWSGIAPRLHPLPSFSSGDVACLAEANALIRVPANSDLFEAGAEMDFLPTAIG